MAAKATKKQLSFEEGLQKLEETAQRMESSQLPLEELMKLYQSGVQLADELAKKLEAMKGALRLMKLEENGAEEQPETVSDQTSMEDWIEKEEKP